MAMRDLRNQTAVNVRAKSARTATGDSEAVFMLREMGPPSFPADILVPSAKGAVITEAPDPDTLHQTAKPARRKPMNKAPSRKASQRKASQRQASASKKKLARKASAAKASIPQASAGNSAPPKPEMLPALLTKPMGVLATALATPPSLGMSLTSGMAKVALTAVSICDDRSPLVPISADFSLARTGEDGLVSRLARWLGGLGSLLPRKRRRAALPRSRQTLSPPEAQRRSPQPRPEPQAKGGARDELAALRAENERLRQELAQMGGWPEAPQPVLPA